MKFLVDAQLPVRLCDFLNRREHDALHVSALPNGNRSSDASIAELADAQDRIVVTKDSDFRYSHLTNNSPRRLLIVATGTSPTPNYSISSRAASMIWRARLAVLRWWNCVRICW